MRYRIKQDHIDWLIRLGRPNCLLLLNLVLNVALSSLEGLCSLAVAEDCGLGALSLKSGAIKHSPEIQVEKTVAESRFESEGHKQY